MKKILLTFVVFSLIGCTGPDDDIVKVMNKSHLSGKGDYMGTLPDGRDVTRYRIDRGNMNSHYIYIVPDSQSTSMNIAGGNKGNNNITSVIIDGRKFIAEEK